MTPYDPRSPTERAEDDFMAKTLAKRLEGKDFTKLGLSPGQMKILEESVAMSARTERNPAPFTVADIAEFWAAIHDLQERVAHLERMEAEQVARNLTQREVNDDHRRRLARLEQKEQGDA